MSGLSLGLGMAIYTILPTNGVPATFRILLETGTDVLLTEAGDNIIQE